MGPVGVPEMVVIFLVALVLFGPKKLPELGKGLAQGIRSFKDGLKGTTTPEDPSTPPKA